MLLKWNIHYIMSKINLNEFVSSLKKMKQELLDGTSKLSVGCSGLVIVYYSASEIGADDMPGHPGALHVNGYADSYNAMMAYAETPCTWSTVACWSNNEEMVERCNSIIDDALLTMFCVEHGYDVDGDNIPEQDYNDWVAAGRPEL